MTSHDTLIRELFTKYSLISDQVTHKEVELILQHLSVVIEKRVEGAVVEFGCYAGTTSLFIKRFLQVTDPSRPFHVYDSFAGLPDKLQQDESPAGFAFKAGELSASKAVFVQNFKKANLSLPIIHKAWFEEITTQDVPDQIALAFLDGDYFSSIAASLKLIEHKIRPGGFIIVDDYHSSTLPGAKKATDAWLANNDRTCTVREGMAVIQI